MAGPKILIVEDEGIVAKDIEMRLKRLDYTVVGIAVTGEEAVKKSEEDKPDLVLMDIYLKGKMNGIEAASIINKKLKIPVVYLTAYGDDNTIQKAMDTAPSGYILKPIDNRELKSTIDKALNMEQKVI